MIFKDMEKALIQPVMQTIAELSIYDKEQSMERIGYLYTLYKKNNHEIRIGYIYLKYELESINKSSEWTIVESRSGVEREVKLLTATLKELGFCPKSKSNIYRCSTKLINYLNSLGWPVGDLLKSRRNIKKT